MQASVGDSPVFGIRCVAWDRAGWVTRTWGLVAMVVLALAGTAGRGVENAWAQPSRPPAAAPEAAPGDPVLVPDESDGALHEPPVIASRNGVLKASADIIRAGTADTGPATLFGDLPLYSNPRGPQPSPAGTAKPPHVPLDFAAGYQFTANGTTYPAQFPAPTLRVEPGETMDLTLRDRLGDEASGGPFPQGSNLVNLHTHGVVDSPRADGDNVFRTMRPSGAYRTRVKLPTDAQPGWDWYHPHRHGFVADQVYGGLAGTLQIGDPLDPWPQYKGKFQERTLALTAGLISVDPQTGIRFPDDPNPNVDLPEEASGGPPNPYGPMWRKFVNGQYNPTITIRPGETQIWGFASMTRNVNFNLGITDANGQNPWSATILSYDGNGKNLVPRPTTLGLPVPYTYDGPTVLDPGARIAMAVTAPTTPGTYYLVDDMTFKLRPQSPFFALATIKVEGDPVTEASPVFPSTGQVPDLFTATPDHKRTFVFSNDTSGPTIGFAINGSFFPNGPIVPVQVGQVEEWLLVNTSPVDHTFHIHQTDFAVTSVNSIPIDYRNPFVENGPYHYTSLRDTVNIPPGGNVVIRFRVSPELGKYVFHCHILPHEDGGMMMTVLALPNQRQRRIALGTLPGERNAVLVKDGNGQRVGTLHPGSRDARGGVVTATEDLNGDLTEDIVAGTPARPGLPASVSVYDGDSLKRISRFTPFPESPRAGLSLAAGGIDRDGGSEIVVGRVGRGPSLVRIFRRSGAVFRTLRGTLPGSLPNGVSVTSSDFNGDNYDDVAVGAGRGRAPRVVALDGFTLGDPSRPPPTTLFSFLAAGGPTAGVNLAAGYYDPRTRPGVVANLITTPQQGRLAGRVQVWAPVLPAEHGSSATAGQAHSAGTDSEGPQLLANLHPLRRRVPGGLRLAVTRLGKQGLDALAAWGNPRTPTYVSINDEGVVSRVEPRTTAGGAFSIEARANLGTTVANATIAWLCLHPGASHASEGFRRRS
jgi:FtsP/CotA-like multicopper oxidase with cupredoxin domain